MYICIYTQALLSYGTRPICASLFFNVQLNDFDYNDRTFLMTEYCMDVTTNGFDSTYKHFIEIIKNQFTIN